MDKIKIAFYVTLSATVIVLGFLSYKYVKGLIGDKARLHEELIGQEQKYKQLSDYTASLEIKYKSQSDLKAIADAEFSDQVASLKDQVKVLSDATFLIKNKAVESNNSDVVFSGSNASFILNEVKFDKNGPPIGYVLIFKDGRVVSDMYQHQIKVDTVVTQDEESGRYTILSKANYILKSPSLSGGTWLNKEYPLPITDGVAYVDPTEPINNARRPYFWNPKLNANLNTDFSGLQPGLGISLMSYGLTSNDSDLKFLQFGIQDNNSKAQPTFMPLLWRPIKGLISNTYIGPGVSFDNPGYSYFLGLSIGL